MLNTKQILLIIVATGGLLFILGNQSHAETVQYTREVKGKKYVYSEYDNHANDINNINNNSSNPYDGTTLDDWEIEYAGEKYAFPDTEYKKFSDLGLTEDEKQKIMNMIKENEEYNEKNIFHPKSLEVEYNGKIYGKQIGYYDDTSEYRIFQRLKNDPEQNPDEIKYEEKTFKPICAISFYKDLYHINLGKKVQYYNIDVYNEGMLKNTENLKILMEGNCAWVNNTTLNKAYKIQIKVDKMLKRYINSDDPDDIKEKKYNKYINKYIRKTNKLIKEYKGNKSKKLRNKITKYKSLVVALKAIKYSQLNKYHEGIIRI